MSEKEPNVQSDFMIEKIKERPVNRGKLVKRMLLTATMAVLFGLIACFTFLALEPILNNFMNPPEELPKVYFPEETEEMSPEEMLLESTPSPVETLPPASTADPEGQTGTEGETGLSDEDIQKILLEMQLTVGNYRQMYAALSEYTKSLQKCMVTITGITSRKDWFDDVNESANKSAGVIIYNNTKELLILTDFKPLERAQRLNVTFCNGAETTAELKRKDPSTHLAVVSVPIEVLPGGFLDEVIAIARQGSSNQSNLVGTPVIALGSPMGTMNSAGYGVITATTGQASDSDANYKLLQTDISGSPLASGVLFNLYGQVVGVITSEHSTIGMENLITAYGITDMKKRMEKLSNDQPFAYLGIYGTSVNVSIHEELNVPYGAYVRDVVFDSPAMRAGILQGDLIVKMDETEISNFSDYMSAIYKRNPDETVRVTILRQTGNDYKEMNMNIILGERK